MQVTRLRNVGTPQNYWQHIERQATQREHQRRTEIRSGRRSNCPATPSHILRPHHADGQSATAKYLTILHGTRLRGRPSQRWLDNIQEDCGEMGMSIATSNRLAQNRTEWQCAVGRLLERTKQLVSSQHDDDDDGTVSIEFYHSQATRLTVRVAIICVYVYMLCFIYIYI